MVAGELRTQLGLEAPDDFYHSLIDAHKNLSDAQSELFNAKLVLLLARLCCRVRSFDSRL